MDLGIQGKTALVCAASKGLGKGCAMALAREGVNLVITARGSEALEATAAEIRKRFGVSVSAVASDITTQEGRDAARAQLGLGLGIHHQGVGVRTVGDPELAAIEQVVITPVHGRGLGAARAAELHRTLTSA